MERLLEELKSMWTFIKLAGRNLLRHKRRSFLTGIMIAVGALTMILSFTFSRTVEKVMTNTAVEAYCGNIQIHADSTEKIDLFFPAPEEIPNFKGTEQAQKIITNNPSVLAVAPRLRFGGLISKGDNPPFEDVIIAIDPLRELRITPKLKLIEGAYLTRKDGILLGKTTAKAMNVKVGQELVIMTSNQDGCVNGYPFIVEGIITHEGIGMFLDYVVYIDIATARKLLYIGNDETFELAVALKKNTREAEIVNSIRKSLTAAGYKLRVESWRNVMPIIYGIIMGIQVMPQMMLLILLIVVAMGINNTVTMSVLERTREIGIMVALGTKRKQIMGLFLLEVGLLSAVSAGFGLLIGTGIILWFGHTGIPITVEAMEFFTGGKRFYFIFNETGLIISLLSIILISAVAAYFPAWAATRLKPVDALRQD
jgi:ABC-type lipoprotein release transport system permease subunit